MTSKMRLVCFVQHGQDSVADEKWIKRRFTVREKDYSHIKKLLLKFEKKFWIDEQGYAPDWCNE